MNDAAYDLARSQQTSEPMMVNVLTAQKMNRILGGALVSPWQVAQLPEDEIEAILSLERVGEYRAGVEKVAGIFDNWRAEHARKQH